MEVTKFEQFNDLPIELRVKIIVHLCDFPESNMSFWDVFPGQVLPFFKSCKRYYLNEIQFAGEFLKIINQKRWNNIFAVGLNMPTPACKLFLAKMRLSNPECKKKCDDAGAIWPKHIHMRDDIKNNRIRFKESLKVTQHPDHQLNTN